MTQPTPEQLEVTQADRDAAADRLESTVPEKFRNLHPATHTAKAIRKGKMDGHPWVQNYARHRILAIQATEARMADAVEAERERCARIASLMQPHPDAAEFEHWRDGFECATVAIAAAIRSATDGQG